MSKFDYYLLTLETVIAASYTFLNKLFTLQLIAIVLYHLFMEKYFTPHSSATTPIIIVEDIIGIVGHGMVIFIHGSGRNGSRMFYRNRMSTYYLV